MAKIMLPCYTCCDEVLDMIEMALAYHIISYPCLEIASASMSRIDSSQSVHHRLYQSVIIDH